MQIDSDEAINSLNIYATPEYWMSEKNIIDLIKTGPLDQWLDALDYAPVGAMDLIKKYSVSLPLTDTRKIEALQKKTGFNVAAAIQHDKESKEPDEVFTKTERRKIPKLLIQHLLDVVLLLITRRATKKLPLLQFIK